MDITVFKMMRMLVDEFKNNNQWGTAHIYQSSFKAFSTYRRGSDLSFDDLSANVIKGFEIYLRDRKCSRNTVATYIKVVKATYNRAMDCGAVTSFTPRLFSHVCTTTENRRKRALDAKEMGLIMNEKTVQTGNGLLYEKLIFRLMFLLRGISFVDLAYLRKDDIKAGTISYCRRKTGRTITVKLTTEAKTIMKKLSRNTPRYSPYIFPLISSPEGTEAAYKEYQRALRKFNHRLNRLSQNMPTHLSTYTARHTWATMAYYCEIHQGIISEAMGHSSIAVTETYLKPFNNDRIDEANERVIEYVKRAAPFHLPPKGEAPKRPTAKKKQSSPKR